MKKRNNYQKPTCTKIYFHTQSPLLDQSVTTSSSTIQNMTTFEEYMEGPQLSFDEPHLIDSKGTSTIDFE